MCMSCAVFFAIRKCIEEARKEAGHTEYFTFSKLILNSHFILCVFTFNTTFKILSTIIEKSGIRLQSKCTKCISNLAINPQLTKLN